MVQSNAPTVDAWLAEVEPARLEAIARLRQLCITSFPGWQESMQWGMPGYGPPGADAAISFNNQKRYIAVYIGVSTIDAYKAAIRHASLGKSCIRYPHPDRIDFDLLETMLAAAFRAKGGVA